MTASIAENYKNLCIDVQAACKQCGRDPTTVTVVGVSKFQSLDSIKQVVQAGCCNLGESRVQEALDKQTQLQDSQLHWHLIGSLQKNKVRKVIGHFCLIHSVDSIELAQKISEVSCEMGMTSNILLQANTSGELSKHGLSGNDWLKAYPRLMQLPNLSIEGLMTMAPLIDDEEVIRACFRSLRLLKDEINVKFPNDTPLRHLSMGMSHDWRLAVLEGATLVRIGTAIFA